MRKESKTDQELDRIIAGWHYFEPAAKDKFKDDIKQAIDEYVIGKDKPLNGDDFSWTQIENRAVLRGQQRKALYNTEDGVKNDSKN